MHRVRASILIAVFTWIGLTSLGGGRAAYFHEDLVVRRRWLTDDEFLQGLTLSHVVPGPTFSNIAVALGHRLRGATGAACGLLAVLLPGALSLLALSALYFGRGVAPEAGVALHGMGAAVVGLVFVTTARLARGALRGRAAPAIAAITFLAAGPLRLNTFVVVLAVGLASLWINRPDRARRGSESRGSFGPKR